MGTTGTKIFEYKPDSALILKLLEVGYDKPIFDVCRYLFDVGDKELIWNSDFSGYKGVTINPGILHKFSDLMKLEDDSFLKQFFVDEMYKARNQDRFPENMPYGYLCWEIARENNLVFLLRVWVENVGMF